MRRVAISAFVRRSPSPSSTSSSRPVTPRRPSSSLVGSSTFASVADHHNRSIRAGTEFQPFATGPALSSQVTAPTTDRVASLRTSSYSGTLIPALDSDSMPVAPTDHPYAQRSTKPTAPQRRRLRSATVLMVIPLAATVTSVPARQNRHPPPPHGAPSARSTSPAASSQSPPRSYGTRSTAPPTRPTDPPLTSCSSKSSGQHSTN